MKSYGFLVIALVLIVVGVFYIARASNTYENALRRWSASPGWMQSWPFSFQWMLSRKAFHIWSIRLGGLFLILMGAFLFFVGITGIESR
jgi:hypothetical protein